MRRCSRMVHTSDEPLALRAAFIHAGWRHDLERAKRRWRRDHQRHLFPLRASATLKLLTQLRSPTLPLITPCRASSPERPKEIEGPTRSRFTIAGAFLRTPGAGLPPGVVHTGALRSGTGFQERLIQRAAEGTPASLTKNSM